MPAVRRYIARALNREPAAGARPDTAIAVGAGICSGMKARAGDLKELVLTDVCPFTLGINVINEAQPDKALMSPIIERNSVLPTSKEGTYYTARDNQRAIDVKVYQGEQRYCDDNTYLGHLEIAVPPGPRGSSMSGCALPTISTAFLRWTWWAETARAAGWSSRARG